MKYNLFVSIYLLDNTFCRIYFTLVDSNYNFCIKYGRRLTLDLRSKNFNIFVFFSYKISIIGIEHIFLPLNQYFTPEKN